MPIRPFLDGQVFDQNQIDAMSQALADVCRELGLKDKEDAVVRLIAMKIIAAAKTGVDNPALLKAAAVNGLGKH